MHTLMFPSLLAQAAALEEAQKTVKKKEAEEDKKRKAAEKSEVEKPKRRRGKTPVAVEGSAAPAPSEPSNPSQPSNPQNTAEIPDPAAAAAAAAAAKKDAAAKLRRKNAKVGLEALEKAQIEDLKLPDIATFDKLSFTCPAPSWVHGSRSIGVILPSQSFYAGKCSFGSGDLGMPSGCEHLKASPIDVIVAYMHVQIYSSSFKLFDVNPRIFFSNPFAHCGRLTRSKVALSLGGTPRSRRHGSRPNVWLDGPKPLKHPKLKFQLHKGPSMLKISTYSICCVQFINICCPMLS